MSPRSTLLLALAAAAVLDGCACDSVPDAAVTSCEMSAVVQGAVMTDILFVVDDSGSMQPHQTNLANNLSNFITALKSSPVANDFQIGVTTTSIAGFTGSLTGEQGALIANVPAGTPAILTGDRPNLVSEFSARVAVGTSGSGKEQPLRAVKAALSSPLIDAGNANAGFLRPGARLAVVILTDEDDCSDSVSPPVIATGTTDGNRQCHNDFNDDVDYKGLIDPVSGYVGFLRGAVGGEVRDVVVAVIAGMDATTQAPTCGYAHTYGNNGWGCDNAIYDLTSGNTCTPGACGLHPETNPATAPNQTMDVYCCCAPGGTSYVSTCPAAYDKADRLVDFVDAFAVNKRVGGSICDTSFASTLQQIAGLIISPTVPLAGVPADYRMLVVGVQKPDGSRVACTVALEGSPEAATADAVYAPASSSKPATLTFQDAGACRLDGGDRIQIDVICAG